MKKKRKSSCQTVHFYRPGSVPKEQQGTVRIFHSLYFYVPEQELSKCVKSNGFVNFLSSQSNEDCRLLLDNVIYALIPPIKDYLERN